MEFTLYVQIEVKVEAPYFAVLFEFSVIVFKPHCQTIDLLKLSRVIKILMQFSLEISHVTKLKRRTHVWILSILDSAVNLPRYLFFSNLYTMQAQWATKLSLCPQGVNYCLLFSFCIKSTSKLDQSSPEKPVLFDKKTCPPLFIVYN